MKSRPRYRGAVSLLLTVVLGWSLGSDVLAFQSGKRPHLARDAQQASHRGVCEVELKIPNASRSHFEPPWQVTFTRPDASTITVDAFPDGDDVYRARAYCDQVGRWRWSTTEAPKGLTRQSGEFQVAASDLPGKLRKHPQDSRQFAYDNGEWFLHIGDTGYRYVTDSEPRWRQYIDQAVQMGATKTRVWFCKSRYGVEALLTADRKAMNLPYWQEIDRRVTYALEHHPHLILQLVPYGEDTDELRRYAQDDSGAFEIARHAQARFSAFPNVHWCISNDMILGNSQNSQSGHRRLDADVIRRIGADIAKREPWGTLLTNHQSRHSGYDFTNEPWSDIITLEDLDQVHGELILEYRQKGRAPVVNDEDRYELYQPPANPRYFFRRLMWVSLLSGGHATYGGLKTYEPFDGQLQGVQGYFDACKRGALAGGADDFVHIHTFFRDSGLTLVGYEPDDACVGNDPLRVKCIRNASNYIVYHANPSETGPGSARPGASPPEVNIMLPAKSFRVRWFEPATSQWTDSPNATGPKANLRAPGGGDWMLLLQSN